MEQFPWRVQERPELLVAGYYLRCTSDPSGTTSMWIAVGRSKTQPSWSAESSAKQTAPAHCNSAITHVYPASSLAPHLRIFYSNLSKVVGIGDQESFTQVTGSSRAKTEKIRSQHLLTKNFATCINILDLIKEGESSVCHFFGS